MTEAEWLACTGPGAMLDFVRHKASDRKLRLFLMACCRRVWHQLTDERSRRAVEAGELFAEGRVAAAELADIEHDHNEVVQCGTPSPEQAAPWLVHWAIDASLDQAFRWIFHDDDDIAFIRDTEAPAQAALLRDVVGDPFRPVSFPPSWLAWNSRIVARLARAIYKHRNLPDATLDGARLAILADALEEAGCTDARILGHCRSGGPHVCGCWVVDLALGKS